MRMLVQNMYVSSLRVDLQVKFCSQLSSAIAATTVRHRRLVRFWGAQMQHWQKSCRYKHAWPRSGSVRHCMHERLVTWNWRGWKG